MRFHSSLTAVAILLACAANALPKQQRRSPDHSGLTSGVKNIVDTWPKQTPLQIAAAKNTAKTDSPTSNVTGHSIDRFMYIFLENKNKEMANAQQPFQDLAKLGINLTDYNCVVHPSQPNYVASLGGDLNGVVGDYRADIDAEQKNIIDLLDAKNVSFSTYQQDMPYTGFNGTEYDDPNSPGGKTQMYVRRHNPLMIYHSVSENPARLARIKNDTMFYTDMQNRALPQWIFFTPNMTNNGHNPLVAGGGPELEIGVSANWAKSFITPLLDPNSNFNKDKDGNPIRSLIFLTWDESEIYTRTPTPDNPSAVETSILGILLGTALPKGAAGTTDNNKYNHYSILKTVEQNWDLGDLGKGDKNAIAFFPTPNQHQQGTWNTTVPNTDFSNTTTTVTTSLSTDTKDISKSDGTVLTNTTTIATTKVTTTVITDTTQESLGKSSGGVPQPPPQQGQGMLSQIGNDIGSKLVGLLSH